MSGITEDKLMAYIGFLLIMIGLAATGEAIDGRGDIVCAVAMTVGGAWLMWLNREEDEDSEEDNGSVDLNSSSPEVVSVKVHPAMKEDTA